MNYSNALTKFNIPWEQFKLDCNYSCKSNSSPAGELIIATKVQEKGIFYSYELGIINYFLCSMNLTIKFVESCSDAIKLDGLCLTNETLEDYNLTQTQTIPYKQFFQIEIISALKFMEDYSYLAFMKLLSLPCWILIISLLIIYSIVVNLLIEGKMSKIDLIFEFYGNFVNQSSNKFGKLSNWAKSTKIVNYLIYDLLFLYIFCSNFITKEFINVLLNSYFKFKTSLIAGSLEDILDDESINVGGRAVIKDLETINQTIMGSINYRILTYEDSLNIDTETRHLDLVNKYFLEDIFGGQTVLLLSTEWAEKFTQLFKVNIGRAEEKYIQSYFYYTILRTNKHLKMIYRILKIGIENGFFQHQNMLRDIVWETSAKQLLNSKKIDLGKFMVTNSAESIINLVEFYRGCLFCLIIGLIIAIYSYIFEIIISVNDKMYHLKIYISYIKIFRWKKIKQILKKKDESQSNVLFTRRTTLKETKTSILINVESDCN